jgi:hypothetical protein
MELPCLGANQKYVIAFVFYSAKTVKFSFNTLALYAIQLYEDKNGMSDHRHVGISLGILTDSKRLNLLPFDFSCWNGRKSGAAIISEYKVDETKFSLNVLAHDILFFETELDTFNSIVSSFVKGPTANRTRDHRNPGHQFTVNQNSYPTVCTIIGDYARSLFRFRWKEKDMKARMCEQENVMQCSQFVLKLVLHCIEMKIIQVTFENKNKIKSLVFQGTALHPHTLFTTLKTTNFCHHYPKQCKVTLDEKTLPVRKMCIDTPENVLDVPAVRVWEYFNLQRNT